MKLVRPLLEVSAAGPLDAISTALTGSLLVQIRSRRRVLPPLRHASPSIALPKKSLLDLRIDAMKLLRAQEHPLPVIFITAFPNETIRARALKAGATCFLTKPFDGLTLIKCLETALHTHGGGANA